MKPKSIAIVGAAETTELGRIPELSQIGLHADAALNAMKDCGIGPKDIDGVATAGETPTTVAHYLGITPKWVDGTAVGGCSFMIHVRHAAAALESGMCNTVLITHGESGRTGVDRKSTRLNSSHTVISYAVFCLKKKKAHWQNLSETSSENEPARD